MTTSDSMSRREVVITGLGFISSIGNSNEAVLDSIKELRHGIEPFEFLSGQDSAVKVAGTVKDFNVSSTNCLEWTHPAAYTVPREILRGLAPHGLYAYCATLQAIQDAGLDPAEVGNEDTGLYCASAGSPRQLHHYMRQLTEGGAKRGHPMGVVSSISGTLNFNLGAAFKIRGANCGFSSACASSSHALGYAYDDIVLGRLKRMLVVAGEDLNAESMLPFLGMRALSLNANPDTASRPFDAGRDGFVGTGGGVALILEEGALARARGARIYAQIAGWGQAADGHNIMISQPNGDGLALAMRRALKDACIEPDGIGYINAHATSTPAGDLSEARAIATVFPPGTHQPWVSSTKALTGHGLSMAGALEGAICALAIHHQIIPGAANISRLDPACAHLRLPLTSLSESPGTVLHNSSGFGGSNVCLVMKPER
ncbi:MAG: beta-ketoacyl-[acyl-carrier-protein] synthase family protein [Verrucomicrobiota bacterium]|nr:beta-ketoacyl-[acyl-carrier-protein] synthase family protein [Verrucomicrobiota bacterium]